MIEGEIISTELYSLEKMSATDQQGLSPTALAYSAKIALAMKTGYPGFLHRRVYGL